MWWVIVEAATGEIDQVVLDDPGDRLPPHLSSIEISDLPDLTRWRWDPATLTFVPHTSPRWLSGLEILGLYTAAQHARARRMLMAVYPAGHEWAGQPLDPDGLTQRLLDATLALREPISTASSFHQQGTAWMRGVGVIESDEEAGRIGAGITPEEASGQ